MSEETKSPEDLVKPNHDEAYYSGKDFSKLKNHDFEPKGTVPVVGDVLCAWPERRFETYGFKGADQEVVVDTRDEQAWTRSGRCPSLEWFENGDAFFRVLKRKPKDQLPTDTRSPIRVYLAGPMTGLPDFNFPAFHAAEAELLKHYKTVFNPARNFDGQTDLPRSTYMRKDFEALLQSDVIAVLPGWSQSAGAKAEVLMAGQLGLMALTVVSEDETGERPIFGALLDAAELVKLLDCFAEARKAVGDSFNAPPAPETILQEAQRLVGGDRGADYGHPLDDYNKTGMIWGALLHKWAKEAAKSSAPLPVPADLACLMMVGVKLSRHVNKRKRDNLVDAAGYLRCTEMCEDESDRRLGKEG